MRPPARKARTPALTASSICGNTAATARGTLWSSALIRPSRSDSGSESKSIEAGLRSSVGTSATCTFTRPRGDRLMHLLERRPRLLAAMLSQRHEQAVGDVELGDATDRRARTEEHVLLTRAGQHDVDLFGQRGAGIVGHRDGDRAAFAGNAHRIEHLGGA